MRKYDVILEIQGRQVVVGYIEGDSFDDARFQYDEDYLSQNNPKAISVSLPVRKDPFSAEQTRVFFDGLLPEGFMRKTIASNMHFDERDYLSILYYLGKECLGAIRIGEAGDVYKTGYDAISSDQVRQLAAEGATKSSELVIKTHLSLTGASGKVGLYYDGENDKWYLPSGISPSTHIVKQSHIRLDGIVTNEQLSMMAAKKCGIDIPESFIINMGKGIDSEVLFATRRYDRVINEKSEIISGLRRPFRLHQEDFAQALGIAAADKYEKNDENYVVRMFEVIRKHSGNPLEDQLKLWRRIIFDYVLGNTDAHIKNFSLLYSYDLGEKRLSPAYDMISTAIYEAATREMSFNIGGKRVLDEIGKDDFKKMASQVGIGEKISMSVFEDVLNGFENSIHESASELSSMGFENAMDIGDRILHARRSVL
ncbi:HipA domain-containing protein [Butyrivibrio sp. INlla16]|uniref:HipA domain-containing protein n=1 Tax=Butyrivibrio sp. INlla16 TaxID=1520807 RepID=UPI00088C83D9|nr:HipA domain-containing protein [Butyrivibrio sp. INlla16]SDB69503.1 serine/threonine-protein kinase HipA [Butyrivibrio sp. INlla16]